MQTNTTDDSGRCGSACNDVLGPLPARWYCVSRDGLAALCLDEANAKDMAAQCDIAYPRHAPHRAVLLGDVAAERERCAKLCEHMEDNESFPSGWGPVAYACADAIRRA